MAQSLIAVDFSYLDKKENVQGPFCAECMQIWYEANYLPRSLEIHVHLHTVPMAAMLTLGALCQMNGEDRPFYSASWDRGDNYFRRCAARGCPKNESGSLPPSSASCTPSSICSSEGMHSSEKEEETLQATQFPFLHGSIAIKPLSDVVIRNDLLRTRLKVKDVSRSLMHSYCQSHGLDNIRCEICKETVGANFKLSYIEHVISESHLTMMSNAGKHVSQLDLSNFNIILKTMKKMATDAQNHDKSSQLEQKLSTLKVSEENSSRRAQKTQEFIAKCYNPFFSGHCGAAKEQTKLTEAEVKDALKKIRKDFASISKMKWTEFFHSIGWALTSCNLCKTSIFPSCANAYEHCITDIHAETVMKYGLYFIRKDVEMANNYFARVKQYKPDCLPSGQMTSISSSIPFYTRLPKGTEPISEATMYVALGGMLKTIRTVSRTSLNAVAPSVLTGLKSCLVCNGVNFADAYDVVTHALSLIHLAQHQKVNGGVCANDIQKWEKMLKQTTKFNVETVPEGEKLVWKHPWDVNAIPMLSKAVNADVNKEDALNMKDLVVKVEAIREVLVDLDTNKFDAKFSYLLKNKLCEICNLDMTFTTPTNVLKHIVSPSHVVTVGKLCPVTVKDLSMWKNMVNECKKSQKGVTSLPVNNCSTVATKNECAVNALSTSIIMDPSISFGNHLPLTVIMKTGNRLNQSEVNSRLKKLSKAFHDQPKLVDKLVASLKRLDSIKVCLWCNMKSNAPKSILSHIIALGHSRAIIERGGVISSDAIAEWENKFRKAGMNV